MREAIGQRKLEDEYDRFLREMRGEAYVELRLAPAAAGTSRRRRRLRLPHPPKRRPPRRRDAARQRRLT